MADWPSILRVHGPLVWRTAFRLLNHEADAQDCFQQTFLAAVQWSASATIHNWPAALRRLATARALEILRARYRQRRRSEPLTDGHIDPGGEAPLDLAARGELVGRLRAALAEIDPAQASAFCLAHLEGMAPSEVADELGITANHARVLLHRARQAVRARLSAFDPAAADHHRGGAT